MVSEYRKSPPEDVIPELLKAGESVYSHEIIDIAIHVKPAKCVKMCEACSESFVSHGDEVLCGTCTDT